MTWQLRRATPDDVDGIMRLETGVFGADAWSTDTMLREVQSAACWYVVAFRPASPEAIEAYAGLHAPRGSATADIQTIAVAPESRRGGLGRTLVRTLINEAIKRGAREVFLEVRADNPGAQSLYRSLGFEQIAVRKRYYQPGDVDALVMRLTVSPRRPAFTETDTDAQHSGRGPQAELFVNGEKRREEES